MDVDAPLVPVPIRRSRLGRRSVQKGALWERKVCRMIGLWWCNDRESFWRTRGSGAHSKRTGIHHGDIAPVKFGPAQAPLTIECKHVKDWSLPRLLVGGARCKALRFWNQLCRERRAGTFRILVLRGNGTPIYAMVGVEDLRRIAAVAPYPEVPRICLPGSGTELWTFADFVMAIPPASILAAFGTNHPEWRG